MNIRRVFLLCVMLSSALLSCTPEGEPINPDPTFVNAFPLKPGNYWIYRTTVTFPEGSKQVFETVDSVWIEKDTVINGKVHFIQKDSRFFGLQTLLSDSADCIIAQTLSSRHIVFSTNFKDTLIANPPLYRLMLDAGEVVSVPAGNYKTVNCKSILKMDPNNAAHHQDAPMHDRNFMNAEQLFYANNVGLVKRESYFIGNIIEENLVRYKIR